MSSALPPVAPDEVLALRALAEQTCTTVGQLEDIERVLQTIPPGLAGPLFGDAAAVLGAALDNLASVASRISFLLAPAKGETS